MHKQYFLKQNGHVSGPYLANQLKQQAAEGMLLPSAHISEDQQHWVCAANVKGLSFRRETQPAVQATIPAPAALSMHPPTVQALPVETATRRPYAANAPDTVGEECSVQEVENRKIPMARRSTERLREGIETARVVVAKVKHRMLANRDGREPPTKSSSRSTKCDVFLSYRRRGGSEIARLVAHKLERIGYRVFLDVEGLAEGDWSAELEQRIGECDDFVPIITKDFFVRCDDAGDVVRKEIAVAMNSRKNIVPFIATDSPFPEKLPDDIQALPAKNGVTYVHEYADQVIAKLCTMLHSGRVGPARLETAELQPKIVVTSVALLLGLCYGYWARFEVGMHGGLNPFLSMYMLVYSSVHTTVFSVLVFVLPLFVIHSFVAAFAKLRPDKYYGGREWAVFWFVFCPLIVLPTHFFVPLTTWTLAGWSYKSEPGSDYSTPSILTQIISCMLGMLIAFATSKIVIKTRAATIASRAIGAGR